MNSNRKIRAVVFDMDGVLLDSEEFIAEAAIAMFKEKGHEVKREDFEPFVGAGEDRYIGGVAEKFAIDLDLPQAKKRTYDLYLDIIKGRVDPLPGAVDFIEKVKKAGLKTAVATSADYVKMQGNLKEIGFSPDDFDVVLTGEAVENKKPSPDIYLLAAEKLGVKPEECLVVEDAVNGVEAAGKAGAKCLGITTSFSSGELNNADWIAPDLSRAPDAAIKW